MPHKVAKKIAKIAGGAALAAFILALFQETGVQDRIGDAAERVAQLFERDE